MIYGLIALALVIMAYMLIKTIWYISLQKKYSHDLRFLQVKIPKKASDSDQKSDNVTAFKQNIEIMNQVVKSLIGVGKTDRVSENIIQQHIVFELIVEKEWIKFIVGVPEDYRETSEKVISAFYPGCVVDSVSQPKYLDEGKYIDGGYFTLNKPSIFPIKTYDSFEADPMDSIISAMSKVESDELMALQFCCATIPTSKYEKMRKNVHNLKEGKKGVSFWSIVKDIFKRPDEKEEKKPDEPKNKWSSQQLGDFDKKIDDELYSVVIRAVAVSPDHHRAERIVTDLSRTMSQYSYVGCNSLTFKRTKDITQFISDAILRTMGSTNFMTRLGGNEPYLLGIKELTSLFHFPHFKFNKNPRLRRQNYKIVPAPEEIPTEGVLIGYNLYGGVKKEIRVKFIDRFRHFYCIGQTGTGKTTMLLTIAKQDLVDNNGFCFIDPHGDFCEHLLSYFPKNRIDDLIYFNVADFRYPIGLNVFESETEEEKDVIISDLIDMFVNMYGHEIFGPRIQDYFRNAAQLLMAQPEGGTISEVMRCFTDKAFLQAKLANLTNPVTRNWWEKTYASMGDREKGEIIPYIQAKFSPFTDSGIVRNIVGQPKSSFNFSEAMQQNKIILVNLSKGLIGEENSQLIGRFITTQIKVAALRRASMLESERKPYFLYIDEFQNYVSKSIESILSEARKYRLGLGIAHQYLDQMKQAGLGGNLDLSKAIFGNIGNMLALKVGAPDAEQLEKEFSPEFTMQDLNNMDKHRGIMKLSVDSMQTRPFTIVPVNPYTPALNNPDIVNTVKQISALKRGRKKELVEKEIFYRLGT